MKSLLEYAQEKIDSLPKFNKESAIKELEFHGFRQSDGAYIWSNENFSFWVRVDLEMTKSHSLLSWDYMLDDDDFQDWFSEISCDSDREILIPNHRIIQKAYEKVKSFIDGYGYV